MRNSFSEEITSLAKKNKKIVLLSGDIGNRIFDKFKKKYPDRFYNCGVAEACMTGVAAGISKIGLHPITYTIATFNTLRNYEQIKLDLCYPNLRSIIVGTGAGLSYSSLGSTHHSLEDIALMRTLPNMTIFCPSDPNEVKKILRSALKVKGPVYIRLGKKNEPHFGNRKKIGSSDLILKGSKNLIISVGNILAESIKASKILTKKYKVKNAVIDLKKVKPLNSMKLKKFIKSFAKIFIIEEHYSSNGAGTAIIEWLANEKKLINSIIPIGIKNEFIHAGGNQLNSREKAGISAQKIVNRILKKIE
tara:strand:+ start:8661 stop:9575 length:915 start_codon:yes stop_codon:yes gene_type:complete